MDLQPSRARTWRFWFASLCVSIAAFFVLGLICSAVVAGFNSLVQSGQGRWLVAAFPMVLGIGLLTMSVGYAVREYLNGEEFDGRSARRRPLPSVSARTGTHYVRLRTPSSLRAASPVRSMQKPSSLAS